MFSSEEPHKKDTTTSQQIFNALIITKRFVTKNDTLYTYSHGFKIPLGLYGHLQDSEGMTSFTIKGAQPTTECTAVACLCET